MSILTTDLRNKRNPFLYAPTYRTVAHYYTNTTKNNEMKDSFLSEEFFFNHVRPLSELLKKNLADTLANQQSENTEMASSKETKMDNNDYSKLSGITNFISGVFSVVSSVMFKKPKSPVDCFDCDHMSHPDNWQYSNADYKNEVSPSLDVSKLNLSKMCDSNTVAAGCCDVEKYPEEQELNNVEANNKLVESCEEKLSTLKTYLQQRHKNKSEVLLETNMKDSTELKPSKSIPIVNCKSKRFKNPNRLCSKRVKTNMKQIIEDEMLFADEVNLDDFSSVEDSPSFHSLEKWSESPQSNGTPQDYFDEISGRFQTGSAISSEDSFQIVFSDLPKRVRSTSDCDSEDSFIIFEDSPDSCYTSNDVFCDSDDGSDSDSYVSDSGCGNMKLSQSLSRTVSNLTDDNLYDEVDSGNSASSSMVLHKDKLKSGLVVEQQKNLARKELPVKKVHFSPLPPKVHVMHVWAFAARQARAGHWEQYALDRERFRRRIADADLALSWVLKPQHRSRIMFQRFMPWWNTQKRKELAEKNEPDKASREAEEEGLKEKKAVTEETEENNTQQNEPVSELQDREKDSHQLGSKSKQREIITNSGKNSQEDEEEDDVTIQRKRKHGQPKSLRIVPEDVEILHTKAENQRDRDDNGINIVRHADKRILKSIGI